MDGSAAVEVAIGLAYLYILLSLICSALAEIIAQLTSARGRQLRDGLRYLISDPQILDAVYNHPLIRSLGGESARGFPAYIPARTFALAFLDVIAPAEQRQGGPDSGYLRTQVAALANADLRRALLPLLDLTEGDLLRAHEAVGQWFDDMADRISGWYKRRAQTILIIFAAVVTVGLNADTIAIAGALWDGPLARQRVVVAAQELLATADPDDLLAGLRGGDAAPAAVDPDRTAEALTQIRAIRERLGDLEIPLGWSGVPDLNLGLLSKLCGLLLTVVAISLGAPFWFDVLNKVARLRSEGSAPAREN